jgi:hypothetical protein
MTTTSATARGPSSARPSSARPSSLDTVDRQVSTGPFMLTLCQLEGPISIRQPQSPQLRRFTFFTTSSRQIDGAEQVSLHMGYFQTLTDAQSLLRAVRRRFPRAVAMRAPATSSQLSPRAPAVQAGNPPGVPGGQGFAPVAAESLTDTQVMRILETRSVTAARSEIEESNNAPIGVLRPEDTSIRRALKEAVVQGAPVFFAVQLDWSAQPIDLGRAPPFPIFKTHTLYGTESRREGRCRYFLRLGFFADAAAAKEAAASVRTKFASAVVVPVTEEEMARAHEASTGSLGFADAPLPIGPMSDRSGMLSPAPKAKPLADRPRRSSQSTETLEQTLETLAAREMWNDPDSLSDTGVRHLRIEVLERKSGSS